MKEPKKPVLPKPPKEARIQEISAIDLSYFTGTLQDIIDSIREKEPDRPLSDFHFSCEIEHGYYNECSKYCDFTYSKEIENTSYGNQLRSYKKKKKEHPAKLKAWKEAKKKYDIWKDGENLRKLDKLKKEIESKQKILKEKESKLMKKAKKVNRKSS